MLEKEDEGARQSIQTMVKYLECDFLNLGTLAVIVDVVAAVATLVSTAVARVVVVVTRVQLIFLTILVACRPPLGDTGVTPKIGIWKWLTAGWDSYYYLNCKMEAEALEAI